MISQELKNYYNDVVLHLSLMGVTKQPDLGTVEQDFNDGMTAEDSAREFRIAWGEDEE